MSKKREKKETDKRGNKIVLEVSGSVLDKFVSKFGTGAHVIVPSSLIGKKVKIILEGEKNE